MENYDITIQSQLIDEKEGYQIDYPIWGLRIINWLIGFFKTIYSQHNSGKLL